MKRLYGCIVVYLYGRYAHRPYEHRYFCRRFMKRLYSTTLCAIPHKQTDSKDEQRGRFITESPFFDLGNPNHLWVRQFTLNLRCKIIPFRFFGLLQKFANNWQEFVFKKTLPRREISWNVSMAKSLICNIYQKLRKKNDNQIDIKKWSCRNVWNVLARPLRIYKKILHCYISAPTALR